MSDDADAAQLLEERERSASLAAIRRPPPEPGRRKAEPYCESCGDEIEAERLAVQPHARRCLQCQEARERLQRLFSRG